MADDLLEVVEKLQSRLSENQEPRKLLKTLKRLEGLPMTVDILVETGVGKSVNSLRKHESVGGVAKSLVARWKTLVPQTADRPSSGREMRGHMRGADGSPGGHRRPREPSPEEPQYVEEQEEEEEEEEEEEMEEHQPEQEDVEEESQYHPSYSPSPPHDHYSPQRVHRGPEAYQSDEYESPQKRAVTYSPPPRKEVRHSKQHKDPVKDRAPHSSRELERHRQHAEQTPRTSGASGSGSEGKRRSTKSDQRSGATQKSSKHSRHAAAHTSKESRKEKRGTSEARTQDRRASPEAPQAGGEDEAFEPPTMSFESFLTYDAPAPSKKKKKPLRPSTSCQPASAAPAPAAHAKPPKPAKTNGAGRKRSEPATGPSPTPPAPEKRQKVVDVVPTLPDIPLPAIQPNYRPLPSIDLTPLSPQRRKVPVSCDEEDAGFTGRRLNTKMSVYSGSKTTYLPKMMSLYEQCIRVLQNNIDSIDEVGGVPFEILQPVLERCTPEQLFRIEQCNQCFLEDTDDLWMRHCQRDFKHESLQEYESWREMYLRLYEEREERLRMLTQNISSAHANRPKGRQVKMAYVNSVAKPPRDVRRRQEKFGTMSGSAEGPSCSGSSSAGVPGRQSIAFGSQFTESTRPAEISVPPPPRSSLGGQGTSAAAHSARDKPQVKKIAPMMAKTIKAFKNRFSRR